MREADQREDPNLERAAAPNRDAWSRLFHQLLDGLLLVKVGYAHQLGRALPLLLSVALAAGCLASIQITLSAQRSLGIATIIDQTPPTIYVPDPFFELNQETAKEELGQIEGVETIIPLITTVGRFSLIQEDGQGQGGTKPFVLAILGIDQDAIPILPSLGIYPNQTGNQIPNQTQSQIPDQTSLLPEPEAGLEAPGRREVWLSLVAAEKNMIKEGALLGVLDQAQEGTRSREGEGEKEEDIDWVNVTRLFGLDMLQMEEWTGSVLGLPRSSQLVVASMSLAHQVGLPRAPEEKWVQTDTEQGFLILLKELEEGADPATLPHHVRKVLARVGDVLREIGEEKMPVWETRCGFLRRVQEYDQGIRQNAGILFLASIPLVLVSWQISLTSMKLVTSSKRRESGLLRCRGWSQRKTLSYLISGPLALGGVGGLIGLLVALVMASCLSDTPPTQIIQSISPTTAFLSLLAGSIIALGATLGPATSTTRLGIREALEGADTSQDQAGHGALDQVTGSVPSPSQMGRCIGRWSIILFIGSLVLVGLPLLSSILSHEGVLGLIVSSAPSSLIIPLFLFGCLGLLVSVSRILTLGIGGVSRSLAGLVTRIGAGRGAAGLARILAGRQPGESHQITLLAALGIGFSVFLLTYPVTIQKAREADILFMVGSDAKITGQGADLSAISGLGEKELASLGAEQVCVVTIIQGKGLGQYWFLVLDPEKYLECVKENPMTTQAIRDALVALEAPPFREGSVILPVGSLEIFGFKKGEEVGLSAMLPLEEGVVMARLNLTVAGAYPYLPGIDWTRHLVTETPEGAPSMVVPFVISAHYLSNLSFGGRGVEPGEVNCILVKALPGTDSQRVAEAVAQVGSPEGPTYTVSQDRMIAELRTRHALGAVLGFLQGQGALTLLGAGMGIGILLSLSGEAWRFNNFSLRAKGFSRYQLSWLHLGRTAPQVLLGAAIGLGCGLVAAWGAHSISQSSLGYAWKISLTMPLGLWVGSTAYFLLMVSVCVIYSYATARSGTAILLRQRLGE